MEILLSWEYDEPAESGSEPELKSYTYDSDAHAPLMYVTFGSDEVKFDDVIKDITIDGASVAYTAEFVEGVYVLTFTEPADAGNYEIAVNLTDSAQADLNAEDYKLTGVTGGTYTIDQVNIDMNPFVGALVQIYDSEGNLVTEGNEPSVWETGEEYTAKVSQLIFIHPDETTEPIDFEIVNEEELTQSKADDYFVKVKAKGEEGKEAYESNFYGEFWAPWHIRWDSTPQYMDFYYIGDRHHPQGSFCSNCSLPATGFSSRIAMPLSVKPENLVYTDLNMSIQIPSMNMEAVITGVPQMDESWAVEWLGDKAGLLAGSHLPGEGTAVIAAHNTLNNTEYGPFALLAGLEENDVMFINKGNKGMDQYRVYANKLVGPNDMDQVIAMADEVENSLVLVTCENEATEGGYLNRRVVFAKPL